MTKEQINKNRLGLTLGIFFALLHGVWALAVSLGLGKDFLDFILPLHFLDNIYSVLEFNFLTTIMLILMAFVACYIMGWLIALIWNWTGKLKK